MKIAINGFGRIGRAIFKIALDKKVDVVAVNDVHGAEAAAYALKFDSVYGKYNRKVEAKGNYLIVDGKKVIVLSEKEPEKLPWKKLGVDVVVESTGVFTKNREAAKHLRAGAKKVIVTAPAESDLTLIKGANESKLKKSHCLVSLGSCTTNCAAPVVKTIMDNFGIESAMLTTVHAYTNDQVILDNPHKNVRRGRAAGLNMIPTTTGAAEAVVEAIPELRGKLTGMSVRVPVSCGSLIDLTVHTKKKTSLKEVNEAFRKAATGKLKGIVEYSSDNLVSSDIVGNPHSAVFDSLGTQVTGNLVKILAWYDNEFGYSNRVVEAIKMLK